MRKRLSTFPLDKPFEKLKPINDFSEIMLRLIVGFETATPYVVGTATAMCKNMLVTARHVIEEVFRIEQQANPLKQTLDINLMAIQIIPGPEYQLWQVMNCWLCPNTDIAILQLAGMPSYSGDAPDTRWKQPILSVFPPPVGETVAAFGYRKSSVRTSLNTNGGFHYDLHDEPMMSVGKVREIFEISRDPQRLPFPCYHVGARFDGGMSGGPVFFFSGAICGIVCASIAGSHEHGEPISYVCTLWPMFAVTIGADRGDDYPRGIQYEAIELVRNNIIKVTDADQLLEKYPPQ